MSFEIYRVKNEFFRKVLILIFVSRPIHTFFSFLLFFVGFFYSQSNFEIEVFLFLFLLLLFNHITYALNDINDYESDKLNKRKKLWHGLCLKKQYHSLIKKSTLISTLIILLFLTFFNIYTILVFLILLVMAYTYSVPPFYFKRRFLLDITYNSFGYYLLFLLGFSFSNSLEVPNIFYWVILMIAGLTFHTQMFDYESDKKAGYKNTPLVLKKIGSAICAFLCFFIVIIFVSFQTLIINYFLYFLTLMMFFLIFITEKKKYMYIHLYILYLGILLFFFYFIFIWIPKFV